MFRQGDVLIIPVKSIPKTAEPIAREQGRVVLAHGEVTGHAHAIRDKQAALFRDPKSKRQRRQRHSKQRFANPSLAKFTPSYVLVAQILIEKPVNIAYANLSVFRHRFSPFRMNETGYQRTHIPLHCQGFLATLGIKHNFNR